MIDASKSIAACAEYYGDESNSVKKYLIEGEKKALSIDNRGPILFENDGSLSSSIRSSYSKYGFYIFENVLSNEELEDIKIDLEKIRNILPTRPDSKFNHIGGPALGADNKALNLIWSKPLGDPLGGTKLANGRHQIKMFEPKASKEAPEFTPLILLGSLQFSEACLRTYAHP
jgi:hypothetical protein